MKNTAIKYFLNSNYGGLPEGTEFIPHPTLKCLHSKEAFLWHHAYLPFDDKRIKKVLPDADDAFELKKPTSSPIMKISVDWAMEAYNQAAHLAKQGIAFEVTSPKTGRVYNEDNFEEIKNELATKKENKIDEDGYIVHAIVNGFELKLRVDYFNNVLFPFLDELISSRRVDINSRALYFSPITGEIGFCIPQESDANAVASGFVMPADYDAIEILNHVCMLYVAYKMKPKTSVVVENVVNFLDSEGLINEDNFKDVQKFLQDKINQQWG